MSRIEGPAQQIVFIIYYQEKNYLSRKPDMFYFTR